LDADTETTLIRRHAFFGEEGEDFLRRTLGDVDLGSCRIGDFGGDDGDPGSFLRAGLKAPA
jgi:hypothetical protein